jgi:hypothetical protein
MKRNVERRVAELLAGPRSLLALDHGAVAAGESPWLVVPELPRLTPVDPAGTRLAAVVDDPVVLLTQIAESASDWQWSDQRRARSAALRSSAAALKPLGRLLADAGEAHGWWAPLDRRRQDRVDVGPALDWENPDVVAPVAARVTSTRVGGVPGEAFWDWDGALKPPVPMVHVPVPASARVYEITAADDWAGLVGRYPGAPSEERRRLWRRNWGMPDLPVVTPDWDAVAADWDGVHLTVGGWLTARSRPIPLDGAYTLLEGWETERTVWLRPVTGRPERLPDFPGPVPYWDG